MDLIDQAHEGVSEEFAKHGLVDNEGVLTVEDARSLASLVWLNGYKSGAAKTKQLADEAFAKLQAES